MPPSPTAELPWSVGTEATVSATHVMQGAEGPEGSPHSHDYRVRVRALRSALPLEGWVVDLDVFEAALADTLAPLAGADLDQIRPPTAGSVTVEAFAAWVHSQMAARLAARGIERLEVEVWENERAFGGFAGPL